MSLATAPLAEDQFATIALAVRPATDELAAQLHHATPFSPMKKQLRQELDALRSVVADHEVTAEHSPVVIEAITTRIARLHAQQRRCDTPGFKRELRAEEEALIAVCEHLSSSFGD